VAAPCPRVSRRNAVRRNVMGFILTDICALGGVVLVVGFFISGFRLRRVVGPFFCAFAAWAFFRGHPRGAFAGGFLALASAMRLCGAGVVAAWLPFAWASAMRFCGAGVAVARLPFAWASAMRFCGAGVAPVRGGTYFSLQRQRKVGKRKPLTPLAPVPTHGPPTSPHCTRQRSRSGPLPTFFHSPHPLRPSVQRPAVSEVWCSIAANSV
jgi:hypothetical protein